MNRKYVVLAFLIILGLLFCGCTSQSSQSTTSTSESQKTIPATSSPTPTLTSTPKATTQATSSLPLKFSGNGDDVVSFSATGSALRVFTMNYNGGSNFAIWLKDSQGNLVDLLVNEIGSYNGKKSAKLSSGKYFLDITASGPWSVEITPSVTQIAATSGTPLVLRGTGDDVTGFTSTGTGLRIFTMRYNGGSNFAIWLKDSQGNNVDLLVNEIGSYSGKKSAKIKSGDYYLDVAASGPWSIEIAS